ncbi:glutamate synthase large subunit [Acetobacterium woodii]|uniref:Glutamate synthase ferredoxin dependend large subunit GltA n=2 Tax=Acetobacterium woodii TaxID=33952 RepID=H6LKE2_ACEWD|nr:glutamate synthase ferredoxin dependend large subunit GltA [Acetobacterium woodii DSM 1030]
MRMKFTNLPPKQGLYDPTFEHDACGIGAIVHIKGKKSHDIVQQALTTLINLQHRGGRGAEQNTGDGAGILIQIPHQFLKKVTPKEGFTLPEPGDYGLGMLFMPTDAEARKQCEQILADVILQEGQTLLGWRDVPYNLCDLGKIAVSSMPFLKQVFIKKDPQITDAMDFERKLYTIRKQVEKITKKQGLSFYAASFSSRTVVYKGMLTEDQVGEFYLDLRDPDVTTAIAMVHSRFSTNTFPSWERAHPNRYVIHNGEINTLRGNVNWMYARQSLLQSDLFGNELEKTFPVVDVDGSDSSIFDNTFEFLSLTGRSMAHSAMMMIPEPWAKHKTMSPEKQAFYNYHSRMLEPWDGPAAIAFTDGIRLGAVLDRNGLRPSRYYVTKDDMVILSSEVGVLDIPPENILCKERLKPGRMLMIDTEKGEIINDEDLKHSVACQQPYGKWLAEHNITLDMLPEPKIKNITHSETLIQRQKTFGYTYEDLKTMIIPMAKDGVDPIGAMGNDIPLAVLSDKSQVLFNYFKQMFAQVTNPPIDALREELITGTGVYVGGEGNLINPLPESCHQISLDVPILSNDDLEKIKELDDPLIKAVTLSTLFPKNSGGEGLEKALDNLFAEADIAIENGARVVILSDRGVNAEMLPIPSALAISGLHQHLIQNLTRTKISLIIESGEPREVHHFAVLIGYGATAVNPYLAFETIEDLIKRGLLTDVTVEKAIKTYIKTVSKGVIKVLSKMGISTILSYHGAQIFEAVGINSDVINKYFTRTPSRIEGLGLNEIAQESQMRHDEAYANPFSDPNTLESGGNFQWRADGEFHTYNPEAVYKLQTACRNGDYKTYQEYTSLINEQSQKACTLRGMMTFKNRQPIALDEVESVESICTRFKTGAMSYGSLSSEAHECLAIAMNRIGGKSNTGEGGEDPERHIPLANGDSRLSAIKQVASGRFGVTSYYLSSAQEIQIKMAQGAKPGEGGQLPGRKVYPWIAKTRFSTPGVGLISPPPHHDIYSIEDLAELIHDLKNANREARINVKLVSEVGVGTIAAGVAKAKADVILISGYDGGTGASPRTSIRHAGLPWELGLAETHQTLVLNNLRTRVKVETDGKLLTGKDLAVATLLGAEEYGFATAPLVILGCVMMRVCHLDTCPVGVATQNPELRKRFTGDPAHIVNFMKFIAQELREIMAELGFRTIDEMVGRSDKLEMDHAIEHWKTKGLDFSNILYQPEIPEGGGLYCQIAQNHNIEKSKDLTELLEQCQPALERGEKVAITTTIRNVNRVVGTIIGNEVSKRYGEEGLPEDTITLNLTGSSGQSLGAFIPNGITIKLEGDANDYFGKGLSGGKMVIYPPKEATFVPAENIIVGNVAFYGATKGEAYIGGAAGERFCVRNSGVTAVVESVGDHGCEYMTGGKVVILGKTGRNFAAGMSGGIAYVLDLDESFCESCNAEMVDLVKITDAVELSELKLLIEKHRDYTNSALAQKILDDFDNYNKQFTKVLPRDFKRMQDAMERVKAQGLTGDEALMAAFQENNRDLSRVSGN